MSDPATDKRASRATFSSAWGTVFATAGAAIGLGNIWRFPYMMGEYGGAVFLLAYLLIVVAFGIPALMTEWALGRHTRRGPWQAFQRAGMPGARLWSGLLLLTVTMAASYYGVIIARVLYMALAFGAGSLSWHVSTEFNDLAESYSTQLALVVVTAAAGCAALYFGVRTGIEKVSRIVLLLFFGLFALTLVRVLSLPQTTTGLREFLTPRWDHFTGGTALAALGQAFFSLGLGGTFMLTYGSYMRDSEDIPRSAVLMAASDVTAALMAGLIIFPSAFAFGVPVNGGPPLLFQVMPEVFRHMPAGNVFGAAFFFAVFMVAMLSLMAAYEVVVAAVVDGLGWSRGKAVLLIFVVEVGLASPALLSEEYIRYSDLIWGSTMQPLGGALAIIALAWCVGRAKTIEQLRRNSRLVIPTWLYYWIKWGIPIGILATLGYGWFSA